MDMRPNRLMFIPLVLANRQLRERLHFIGTTLFNVKQKALGNSINESVLRRKKRVEKNWRMIEDMRGLLHGGRNGQKAKNRRAL